MLPTATIEHSMPGRLRVKVPHRRGDVSYFRSAMEKLSKHPKIAGLRANPVTGSILIQHETDLPSIRDIAAEGDLFDLQEQSAPPTVRPARAVRVSEGGSAALDGRRATAAGLAGLALVQAMRGNALGPASENLWNAYGGLRILNNPFIALVFCGLGLLQLTRGRWAGSATSLLFYAFVVRQLSIPSPRRADQPDGQSERRSG